MKQSFRKFFGHFSPANALQFGLFGLIKRHLSPHAVVTYSQTGEDRIIMNLLPGRQPRFYVEVGSNEPVHYSNTFALYCKGWRGITIDANDAMVDKHRRLRKRDIAVCAAVSDTEEDVVFVEYNVHELSTINQQTVTVLEHEQKIIKRETTIHTATLTHLLDKHLPTDTIIDLLSIDVEGHDLNVLKSLDLFRYRPKVIVIEMHNFRLETYYADSIYQHLEANEYDFVGYAVWNGYFVDKRSLSDSV